MDARASQNAALYAAENRVASVLDFRRASTSALGSVRQPSQRVQVGFSGVKSGFRAFCQIVEVCSFYHGLPPQT